MLLVQPSRDVGEEDVQTVKGFNLFDYIHMIDQTKKVPEFDDHFEKTYEPYVVNMYFSLYQDTALIANELQVRCSELSKRVHFLFLHATIPKRKREWVKWYKQEKLTKDVEIVMEVFNYNRTNAEIALSLLSDDQVNMLYKYTMKGGKGVK